MNRIGNDHQFLVVRIFAVFYHVGIGIAAEIAGMGFFTMDQKHRRANLIGVLQNRLIDEALTADDIPAAVGIERAGMITA